MQLADGSQEVCTGTDRVYLSRGFEKTGQVQCRLVDYDLFDLPIGFQEAGKAELAGSGH